MHFLLPCEIPEELIQITYETGEYMDTWGGRMEIGRWRQVVVWKILNGTKAESW